MQKTAELEAAKDIAKYFGYSVSDKITSRVLEILAAHRTPTAQAHAAELETTLRHIQEMASEDIRMGDTSGTIWQIEADAYAVLATLNAERKAQKVKSE